MLIAKNMNLATITSCICSILIIFDNLFFDLKIKLFLRINKVLKQNITWIKRLIDIKYNKLYKVFISNI